MRAHLYSPAAVISANEFITIRATILDASILCDLQLADNYLVIVSSLPLNNCDRFILRIGDCLENTDER